MGGETMNHMQMPMQMHGGRPPFTPSQWQELEHQALIFKYMMAGIPVPADLLIPIKKSLEAITAGLYHHHHQPPDMPWSTFHLGFGKNCDPEPGRCRRTDGKKWRCSKDAFPDSKYCERHMHRGRNRSRKPVETVPHSSHSSSLSLSTAARTNNNTNSNSANTLTSITNNSHSQNLSFSTNPYSAPSRLVGTGGIVQPSTVNTSISHFNLDSGPFAIPSKDYRYMKGEIDEHMFFSSEAPGTSRGLGIDTLDNGWRSMHHQQQPSSKLNATALFNAPSTFPKQHHQHSFLNSSFGGITTNNGNNNTKMEEQEQEQPLRHFFDDWPARSRDSSNLSWCDLDEERSNRNSSTTQLSISIPITSSDFSASNSRSPTK